MGVAPERLTEASAARVPSRRTPLILSAAFFLEEVVATIIATSLPQMAQSLGVDTPRMSLAISAYLLSVAIMLPVSGWLADRFGARRVYCLALSVFVAGSALCGWAESLSTLVLGRIVQGAGGAFMTSVGRLIVVRSVPKDQLLSASNYMIAPALLGSMLGPVVGGFITTYISWRWNFFISIPLGLLAIGATLAAVPRVAPQQTGSFDWWGFALIAFAMASVQMAVQHTAPATSGGSVRAALFVIPPLLLALYIRHARRTEHALIDPHLLRTRTLAVSVYAGGIARIASGALPFVLPLVFQIGFGLDALHSGLLTVATTLGAFTTRASVSAALRHLKVRTLLLWNALALALMIAGLALFRPTTPHALIFVYLFVLGLLRSLQFSNVTALGYADIAPSEMSGATTLLALGTRFFMSCGVGLAATLLSALAGPEGTTIHDFVILLLVLAAVLASSALGFSRLHRDDGWQLTSTGSR